MNVADFFTTSEWGLEISTSPFFQCAGIVLLAVGVEYKWFLDDFYVVHPDQQYYLNLAPSGMIVIGASISFMAVFGYWAARVENNCMLTMVGKKLYKNRHIFTQTF